MNKFTLTAIFLLFAYSVSAQKVKQSVTIEELENGRIETTVTTDKFKVETNYFFDNCFISLGAGTQYYLGDNEKHMHFKDRLTPAIDLSVGKWFSPGLGLQLSYTGYKIKGLWADHYAGQNWITNTLYPNPKKNFKGNGNLYEQKARFFNIHVDGLVNLTNIFHGYKEGRLYSCVPYIGVGYLRSYNHTGPASQTISFNAGIINNFRLTKSLDLNVTIRGMIFDDRFDGEVSGNYYMGPAEFKPENWKGGGQNIDFDGMFGCTIGLTYTFKERGWKKARSVKTVQSNEKEIARLQDRIKYLNDQNEELKNAEPVIIIKEKEFDITFPYLVNFVIDKVKVVNRERVNLGFVAEMMKAFPEKKFMLSGYADKYTGSEQRNIWLADNRAKNVFKVLTEEFGVPAEQLIIGSYGGVDNMYYEDPQLSRSVVITEVEQ